MCVHTFGQLVDLRCFWFSHRAVGIVGETVHDPTKENSSLSVTLLGSGGVPCGSALIMCTATASTDHGPVTHTWTCWCLFDPVAQERLGKTTQPSPRTSFFFSFPIKRVPCRVASLVTYTLARNQVRVMRERKVAFDATKRVFLMRPFMGVADEAGEGFRGLGAEPYRVHMGTK